VEFEIAAPARESRRALILLQYQFQRTYDSTVSDEYKSPIYHSIRAFRKPLAILDGLRDLVNEACGTHLHVTFEHRVALYSVRQAVFDPLITHLVEHCEQTIAFWGRTFCSHARATLEEGERHVCFNTISRHPTLEYRLPRFHNAQQYLAVVQFCRYTTALLDAHFDPYAPLRDDVKPMTPEQLGDRILAHYKKARGAFEQNNLIVPSSTGQEEERVVPCADLH